MTTRLDSSIDSSSVLVPASAALSAWSAHDWRDGIHIRDLSALETLTIETQNSTYEIVLVGTDAAQVLVRGGSFFPVFTPARLAGSSLGGAFLKLHSIHVGFRLELHTDSGVIVTSAVRSVARARPSHSADIM